MIKLNPALEQMISDFKNNRKFVVFETDELYSDEKSLVFYFYLKAEALNEKIESEFIRSMLESRMIDYAIKEIYYQKKRVSPYDVYSETKFKFSVPANLDTIQSVFENLKNFSEEN